MFFSFVQRHSLFANSMISWLLLWSCVMWDLDGAPSDAISSSSALAIALSPVQGPASHVLGSGGKEHWLTLCDTEQYSQVPLRSSELTQSPQLRHPVRTRQGACTPLPSADLWISPVLLTSVSQTFRSSHRKWEHCCCYENPEPLLKQRPHTHPSVTDDLTESNKIVLTLCSCLFCTQHGSFPSHRLTWRTEWAVFRSAWIRRDREDDTCSAAMLPCWRLNSRPHTR